VQFSIAMFLINLRGKKYPKTFQTNVDGQNWHLLHQLLEQLLELVARLVVVALPTLLLQQQNASSLSTPDATIFAGRCDATPGTNVMIF
jgi:hypothetical protein